MDDLKHKVELLEKEKEDLTELLKQGDSSKKAADARRDRMKQLESEVSDLRRKEKEFQKMLKLKEENEKQCEKLRQEIVNIKQERVKLIKQMRADTETFRKFRQEKEKEVNQLKALERKRLIEITKLQEGNHRQEAILRRKNEEITRIQRQLRETCEKQKQVAEKRQQAFDRKDSAMGEKIRQWITQEIEIQVGLSEAQLTKAQLLDERKELSAELAELQLRLGDDGAESDEPPAKMRAGLDQTYVSSSNRNNGEESDEDCLALT
jgi:kinesin family protein 4/21/27